MDILPYKQEHWNACLQVFDSNTPRFFAPAERDSFQAFLQQPNCSYLVMEHEGAIVGCGGYSVDAEHGSAKLVWGMVRADFHGLGLGRFLLMARLREIGKTGDVSMVSVETSSAAATFFEKQGFKLVRTTTDGIGPGLDRVEMVKRLTVCA
jgi:ribosomal protein S18 acetylase RimI-like enzyme